MRGVTANGRADPQDDAGVTLTEVLVVVSLVTAVGGVFLSGVIAGLQAMRRADASASALAGVHVAVERLSRELRVADPLEAATATPPGAQLRVVRQGQCVRLTYRLELRTGGTGADLVEYRQAGLSPTPAPLGQPPLAAACTTAPVPLAGLPRRVLLAGADPTVEPFAYFDAAGVRLDPAAVPSSVGDVASVVLTVQTQPGRDRPARRASTRVQVRNR